MSDLKCVLEEFTIDFSGPTSTIDPGLNAKEIIALHKQLSEKDKIIEALSNNPVGMRGREGSPSGCAANSKT